MRTRLYITCESICNGVKKRHELKIKHLHPVAVLCYLSVTDPTLCDVKNRHGWRKFKNARYIKYRETTLPEGTSTPMTNEIDWDAIKTEQIRLRNIYRESKLKGCKKVVTNLNDVLNMFTEGTCSFVMDAESYQHWPETKRTTLETFQKLLNMSNENLLLFMKLMILDVNGLLVKNAQLVTLIMLSKNADIGKDLPWHIQNSIPSVLLQHGCMLNHLPNSWGKEMRIRYSLSKLLHHIGRYDTTPKTNYDQPELDAAAIMISMHDAKNSRSVISKYNRGVRNDLPLSGSDELAKICPGGVRSELPPQSKNHRLKTVNASHLKGTRNNKNRSCYLRLLEVDVINSVNASKRKNTAKLFPGAKRTKNSTVKQSKLNKYTK